MPDPPLPLAIRTVDPSEPAVDALIRHHLAEMHASTPHEHAFALDPSGLAAPDITLLGAWDGDALAGLGALRELDRAHGEIKSMRTAPTHVRRGVAAAILDALLVLARERGYDRVSLETGTTPEFAAAIAFYEAAGFTPTGPFGDYAASDWNRFFTLALG